MDKLEEYHYFVSPVYMVKKPEFLDEVRMVSSRYHEGEKPDSVLSMTANYAHEPELSEFSRYVSQSAWNVLAAQGYAMDKLVTYFTEMWTQKHWYTSHMDVHVHGGSQITALYFLEVPKDGSKLVIHDPRPGKVIVNLPEKDANQVTVGSQQIVFTPEEGMLILFNSWLPHSLTRNESGDAFSFVHMNLAVALAPVSTESEVEVV